jgi:CHAT domain-containing protein
MARAQHLKCIQKSIEHIYRQYSDKLLNQKQYLALIKPIDQAIDQLEMATLLDTPVLKATFLRHTLTLES